MTKDDEARLGKLRRLNSDDVAFLIGLVDEALAERDAAIADKDEYRTANLGFAQAVTDLQASFDKSQARERALLAANIRQYAQLAALTEAGNGLLVVLDVARAREERVNPDGYFAAWRCWQAAVRTRAEGEGKGG